MMDKEKTAEAYKRFLEVIETLRSENGCPWDKEQTPLSMRGDLIEETFEAVDAITSKNALHAKEELGDVLLNDTMISYMYEQKGEWTIAESINELSDKLIRRHPHVFKESDGASQVQDSADTSDKVLSQWDRIKQNVEGRKAESVLDSVPENFPPLLKSYKYAKKAIKKGFDWPDNAGCRAKVEEEWQEVIEAEQAVKACGNGKPLEVSSTPELDKAQMHLEEELGDLFFSIAAYCVKAGINPENAVARANKKFYERFTFVEKNMEKNNWPMENTEESRNHMSELWKTAKRNEQ
ncbi:MAG: nucleoside triphosphate pyrophosphohydrolase [Treponema sp.]|nr:nucleoside triphosphate pyrophosphohydrolase [Treponema sp.]